MKTSPSLRLKSHRPKSHQSKNRRQRIVKLKRFAYAITVGCARTILINLGSMTVCVELRESFVQNVQCDKDADSIFNLFATAAQRNDLAVLSHNSSLDLTGSFKNESGSAPAFRSRLIRQRLSFSRLSQCSVYRPPCHESLRILVRLGRPQATTKEAISSFSFLPPMGYGAASMPGRNSGNREEIFIIGFLNVCFCPSK
jgi:hypothetical protein